MIVAGPGQTSDLTHETNIHTEMKVNVASLLMNGFFYLNIQRWR